MDATISIRAEFVGHYLSAADRFARFAAKIENEYTTETLSDEIRSEYLAGVQAAVMFSVASIETCVNGLFADARDKNSPLFLGELARSVDLLAAIWPVVNKPTILPKYQAALAACEKPTFDEGKIPYQDARSLIVLRNALVHFEPEWDTDQRGHKKIEDRLRGRFGQSPFVAPGNAFFPMKCLSHGCAEWAVNTAASFIDEFFSRLGMPSRLAGYINRLHTAADS